MQGIELYRYICDLEDFWDFLHTDFSLKYSGILGGWSLIHNDSITALSDDAAKFIVQSTLTNYLIFEGYHTFEWKYNSDTNKLTLTTYNLDFTGENEIDCLSRAVKYAEHY